MGDEVSFACEIRVKYELGSEPESTAGGRPLNAE